MNATSNGGPAFPHHVVHPHGWESPREEGGMTLRDYFAAKALQGLLADHVQRITEGMNYPLTAKLAYDLADAMLAERDK